MMPARFVDLVNQQKKYIRKVHTQDNAAGKPKLEIVVNEKRGMQMVDAINIEI